jgi:E3 ubiquitin-protein ligase RNF14
MNVKEGTVKRLKCMDSTCKDSIPPSVLKQLLSDIEFARWENLLLQKTLDSMTDVVYCPRCEVVCIEDDDHFAQCVRCLFSFCSLCRGPRHVGQECLSAEARLQILKV